MSVSLSLFAGAGGQFFDNNGIPLAGGLLYTYAAGTTTPQATYTTSAGSIANANPIVLDSAGRTANEIWLTAGSTYKFLLKTSTGTQIGSYDNISGANDFSALSAASGSSLIGFIQSGAGAVAETVQTKLRENVSVKDFGAVGNGTTDDTAAVQAAIAAVAAAGGGVLNFPAGTYKLTSGLSDGGKTIQFVGVGVNESSVTFGTVTRLQFNGAISGITLTGNGSGVRWMVLQGDGGAYNTALSGVICNAKVRLEHVYATAFRGHGFNAIHYSDQSYYADLLAMSNAGHGVYINDAVGADANTSIWLNLDVRVNSKSGVYFEANNNFSNTFVNLTSQGNTEYAFYCASTNNNVYGFYSENNTAGGILFTATASNNRVWGVSTSDTITDLSTAQKNWVGGTNEASVAYNATNFNINTYGGGNPGTFSVGWNGSKYAITANVGSNNLLMPITNTASGGTLSIQPDAINLTKTALAAASGVSLGGTTATTVGAAGGASALPATPLGYLIAYVGSTPVKIPYYNN